MTCNITSPGLVSYCTLLMVFSSGLLSTSLNGQTTSDCSGAVVLCGDLYQEVNASLNTGDFYEFTGGCNANLEQSSVWYTFTVQADGLLSFVLDPLNPIDDYDWGLFNITAGGCDGIGSQLLSPEMGCNSYGVAAPEPNGATGISTANGGTGNSNGPGNLNGPAFNADLPVLAGEQYALVVMNWTNSLEGYTIDFGQSTASLYDEVPPQPDSLWVDCTLSEFGLRFDEPVLLSSVQVEDFELIAPDASVHLFTNATALDESGGMASMFSMNIATPITASGTYGLFLTDASGSVEDNCGNVGEGFVSLDLTLLEPLQPDSLWVDCTLFQFGLRIDEPVLLSSVQVEDFELIAPDASAHLFTSVTALDESGGLASMFSMDIATPITASGTYMLFLTDVSGSVEGNCGNVGEGFVSLDLTLLEPPLSWDPKDLVVCPDANINMTVNTVVMQPSSTDYSYVWNFDDGTGEVMGNGAGLESSGDGTYTVEMATVPPCYEAFGSFVVYTEECALTIPNVITPANGDAINNAFLVDGLENWPGSSVRIFNRWGNLIYSSQDFGSTAGWDPKAEEASEGTYWYELRIKRGDEPISIVQESGEIQYPADGNPELVILGSFALFR